MARSSLAARAAIAFVVLSVLVGGAAAQRAPAPADDPLVSLNTAFRESYGSARAALLQRTSPVVVVQFDQLIVLRDGARRVEPFTPPIYHELKAISHAPLALHVMLAPQGDAALDDAMAERLRTYRGLLAAALDNLPARGFAPDIEARHDAILRASLRLADRRVAERRGAADELRDFARAMRPLVLASADDAARAQLDGLHRAAMKLRAELGDAEWRRVHLVVLGPRQPREGNLQYAYFARAMGREAEGRRLFYAEGIFDETRGLEFLGTILLDRSASVAFFDDPLRLERDLLADAAANHIRRLFGP